MKGRLKESLQEKIIDGVRYVFFNFATPVVFYLVFHWKGAKPAIAFALLMTALQVVAHLIFRRKFSAFFLVASGFVVLLGGLDLWIQSPRFFRFEPCIKNAMVGTLFLVSQWKRFPLLRVFAEALPRKIQSEFIEPDEHYVQKLTWVWIVYLYCKSLVFLALAFWVDLGTLVLLKSVLGTGSLMLMILGEWIYRKKWRLHHS